jgi:hypothetical protein
MAVYNTTEMLCSMCESEILIHVYIGVYIYNAVTHIIGVYELK